MNCRVALMIGVVWPIWHGVADNLPRPWSIQELRFSPDGHYILGEGKSGITVLAVQPLEILFRIPSENPSLVNFTPDSNAIVFKTSDKNIERWSVKDRSRTGSTQTPPLDCGTEKLSPDGRSWACLDSKGTLRLFDVPSWKPMLVKRRFSKLSIASGGDVRQHREFPGRYIGSLGSGEIDFSPDGRFVVMSTYASPAIAWDLKEGHRVKLRRALWSLEWPNSDTKDLVFIASDRVIRHGYGNTRETKRGFMTAKVIEFPSGKVLSKPKILVGRCYPATDPGFVGVRAGRWTLAPDRSAVVDLDTDLAIFSNAPAMDVARPFYAAEANPGELGLYEIGKGLQAAVTIHSK